MSAIDVELSSRLPVGNNWHRTLTFLPSYEDNRSVYRTWQSRTAACMEARGFTYIPIEYSSGSAADLLSPLDEQYASVYGYHLPELDVVDKNDYSVSGFSLALEGTDAAPGCGREGASVYGGEIGAIAQEVNVAVSNLDSFVATFPSSDLGISLVSAWRACMKARGYAYDNPDDAGVGFSDRSYIGADELAVRSADLSCDKEVGLTAARSAFERARVDEWIADNATLVAEMNAKMVELRRLVVELDAG